MKSMRDAMDDALPWRSNADRPQSWCQVCAETMPRDSIIIGVDLAPIKAIPKVITFQSDITTEKCRATIRTHLKTWKADCVLHDGAPNVGTAWVQDSYNQAELALHSLKLATEFLVEGGTFVVCCVVKSGQRTRETDPWTDQSLPIQGL